MGKDSPQEDACERSIQINENNSNHCTTSYKKTYEILRKNKLPVTAIFGNSV